MPRRTTKASKRSTTAKRASASVAASYEATGGAGTDFEVDVVVHLLGALLADTTDRLLPDTWTPGWVRVQRRDGPRGFDDITVGAAPRGGAGTSIYIQVKRTFSFTSGSGDFREYVHSLHARDTEDTNAPWLAMIVAGKVTPALADIQALTEWARSACSDADFTSKCGASGVLNARKRSVIAAIADHLQGIKGGSAWRVLRRLRVAEVDYPDESSRDAEQLRDRLESLQEPGTATGEEMRQALRGQALRQMRYSPTYTRAAVLAGLGSTFRLAALPRLLPDLERLDREATLALDSIDTALGGVSLLREELYRRARDSLASDALRLVGSAGCGKSMVLVRLAATAPRRLVLKDDRVSGRTWAEYSGNLGVTISADTIIEALGDRPGAVLAIDGADRLLMSERRGVVLDLLRSLRDSPTRGNWRLLSTSRDAQGWDVVVDAGLEVGLGAGERLEVGGLDVDDAEFLADQVPQLRNALRRTDLAGRNRDLFTLREALQDRGSENVGTEVGFATRWATRGSRAAPPAPRRDAAIAQIGDRLLDAPSALIGRAELDPEGASALLQEGSLRGAAHRDGFVFAHDIYEDWALARALDRRRADIPDLLRSADQPLWWLRALRLVGQIVLEASGPAEWLGLVKACANASHLDPVWWRTLLVAPLYSERSPALLADAEALLLADEGAWLERLIDTLQVLESQPDEQLLRQAEGSAEERLRLAAAFPWPHGRSWIAFLEWAEGRWSAWPGRLVPKLAQCAQIWLRVTEGLEHRVGRQLVSACSSWLSEIESARTFERWEARRAPFGCEDHDYDLWEKTATLLREAMAYGVLSAPEVVETYLNQQAESSSRQRDDDDLLKMPRRIPSVLPRAWADFCIARFAPKRPRVRHEFYSHFDSLDFNDAGLRSLTLAIASPRYAGFDQLFEANSAEALRMLRKFEKRASVFYRDYVRRHDHRRPRTLRLRFPWGEVPLWGDENTYRWARGTLGSETLGSAYMALDLWLARQAAEGRSLEELFRLVLRPHGLNATLCPCINVGVEHINTPGELDVVGPVLAEPRVWNFEVRRFTDDLQFARQPMVPYYAAAHRPAVLEVGERYARRQHLRADLALAFLLKAGEDAQAALQARVKTWTASDLADFDDELDDAATVEAFDKQIDRYRADVDPANIRTEERDGNFYVSIVPPTPVTEEIAALDAHHAEFQAAIQLMTWATKGLDEKAIQPGMDLEEAVVRARGADRAILFTNYDQENFNAYLMAQGVAATAACVACLAPDEVLEHHREWVIETLVAAGRVNRTASMFDIDDAILSHDPAVSAAQGLSGLLRRGSDPAALTPYLLALATNRYHSVATATISNLDFEKMPIVAWAITSAAFADCQYFRGRTPWRIDEIAAAKDRQRRREAAIKAALWAIQRGTLTGLPMPPPHRRAVWKLQRSLRTPIVRKLEINPTLYAWNRAAALIKALPVRSVARDARVAGYVSDYLCGAARWVRDYSEGGDQRRHDAHYPSQLMDAVATGLGRLAALNPDGDGTSERWRDLAAFEERDRGLELVGDFLEGMTREMVSSGERPGAPFWRTWDPAAEWVLGPPGRSPRGSRHSSGGLTSPVAAAGFVGPYSTPIPPRWPHVADLIVRIDAWAEKTKGSSGAAYQLLRFCDRLTVPQIEDHALSWIERWLELHGGDPEFWEYGDLLDRAALVTLRIAPSKGPFSDISLQRRVRNILARLADNGSLAARQALASVAAQRPAGKA